MGEPRYRVHAREFDDFDELCQDLRGWSIELSQLDTGRFAGQLVQVASERTLLSYARFGRLLEQRGDPPPNVWTFGIPAPDCTPFTWRGEEVSAGDVVVVRSDTELDAVSPDGFSMITFSVEEEQLAEIADGQHLGLAALLGSGGVRRGPRARTRNLACAASGIVRQAAERRSAPVAGDLARRLDQELTLELLDCLRVGDGAPPSNKARTRQQTVESAKATIAANAEEPLTVEDLGRAVGASVRTLRRAFQENLGVSPKAYLKAHRLNGVRRLLLRSSPRTTTVTAAANRWGFWHLGQFAADYRRQFGEAPSRTLQRDLDSEPSAVFLPRSIRVPS